MSTRRPWPFGEGKYLSTVSINRNAVSAGPSVTILLGALDLPERALYTDEVRKAVMEAQAKATLPVTGIVTEADWHVLVNGDVLDAPERANPPEKPKRTRKRTAKKAAAKPQ